MPVTTQIFNQIITDWLSSGTVTVASTGGTQPVKPTMTVDKMEWRRIGDSMHIRLWMISSGTSATPGTGDYLFQIPAGYTIDTTKAYVDTHTGAGAVDWPATVGSAQSSLQGTQSGRGTVQIYDTTHVRLYAGPATGTMQPVGQGNNCNYWNASPISYSADFMVPIVGWSSQS